jgi:hypothetical protein
MPAPVKLAAEDVELIDRLVGRDRTVVSTALLIIAGIGGGEYVRRAVLSALDDATSWAVAEDAISPRRAEQIGRHIQEALRRTGAGPAG